MTSDLTATPAPPHSSGGSAFPRAARGGRPIPRRRLPVGTALTYLSLLAAAAWSSCRSPSCS